MRLRLPPDFSFAPLFAMIPGLLLLAAFGTGVGITRFEAVLSALVVLAGAAWAGLKHARSLPEPVTRVDTTRASTILNALPAPVLLLDSRRRVLAANRAADELLGDGLNGRDVCLTLRHPEAQRAVKMAIDEGSAQADAQVVFEAPMRRIYQMQVMAVPRSEGLTVRGVVALHEITALKRVESMRADFVANVSHELRSPLSTLSGFIETLQTTAKDDPDAQVRFLTIMEGEAGRMSRLIDVLLSTSRIEANEHIRPKGRVGLAQLIGEVTESTQIKAAKKNMTVTVDLPADLPDIAGERDELREVFENLIENAVKYGGEGTAIDISGRAIGVMAESGLAGVEVSVRDHGEGIDEEHLPRLTERFYRVDKGRSRAVGGTGLGLAIVKHILNRHRARLLIDSKRGKGSVFTVQLPVFAAE